MSDCTYNVGTVKARLKRQLSTFPPATPNNKLLLYHSTICVSPLFCTCQELFSQQPTVVLVN